MLCGKDGKQIMNSPSGCCRLIPVSKPPPLSLLLLLPLTLAASG